MSESNQLNSSLPPKDGDGAETDCDVRLLSDRSLVTRVFLSALGIVSLTYAGLLIYHVSVEDGGGRQYAGVEPLRQWCIRWGLLSTGNINQDARTYLTVVGAEPLSEELLSILSDSKSAPVVTQEHPLVGTRAPMFALTDPDGRQHQLESLISEGPVVLVFYYGYSCSHCVAQLLALNDDLRYFNELGVRIVAVSPDTPAQSQDAFVRYGRVGFTVLADEAGQVAEQYGCLDTVNEESDGLRRHGTFVVSREGEVVWAYRGTEPFVDNRGLLKLLATLEGKTSGALASHP